jgi:hypothetical protein
MGRRGLHIICWWESQKERDHWEDEDVGGWTILKCILEGWDDIDWIYLTLVNTVMILRFP